MVKVCFCTVICEDRRDAAAVGAKGRKKCARSSTASTLQSREIKLNQYFNYVLAMKVTTLTDHTGTSKTNMKTGRNILVKVQFFIVICIPQDMRDAAAVGAKVRKSEQ